MTRGYTYPLRRFEGPLHRHFRRSIDHPIKAELPLRIAGRAIPNTSTRAKRDIFASVIGDFRHKTHALPRPWSISFHQHPLDPGPRTQRHISYLLTLRFLDLIPPRLMKHQQPQAFLARRQREFSIRIALDAG